MQLCVFNQEHKSVHVYAQLLFQQVAHQIWTASIIDL